MTDAYDLARLRRLLLLLPAAARAATRHGRGVPLAEAVRITGARSVDQVIEDVETLADLYLDPGEGETVVSLFQEDGEVQAVYAEPFGRPPALSVAEGAVLLSALAPFEEGTGKAARVAARKLRRAIPEPLRPDADRLAEGLEVVTAPPGPWTGALREAIDRKLTPGNYLLGFVLGFGGEATVEAPADVADQLLARVDELERQYR